MAEAVEQVDPVDEFDAFASGELGEEESAPEPAKADEPEGDGEDAAEGEAEAPSEETEEKAAEEEEGGEAKAAAEPAPAEEPWRKLAKPTETTPDQVIERLATERDNYQGWARREQGNVERLRDEMGGLRRAIDVMTPIYEVVRKHLEAQNQPEVPDPEKEPDRALFHKVDGIERRLDARQKAEEEAAVERHWQAVDAAGWGVLSEGFSADAEFQGAHDHVARTMVEVFRRDYPAATDDQAIEAVATLERMYLRQKLQQGWNADQIRDDFKERARLYGFRYEPPPPVQPEVGAAPQPAPAPQPPAGNGNGAKPKSSVRRAAERQEAARGVAAPGAGGRASRALPSAKDLTSMSEDELFDLRVDANVSEEAILAVLAEAG